MTDFLKVGGSFSQKSVTDFPKSVAHFPKVGDRFPQVGGTFSLNQLHIFPTTEPIMLFQTPGFFFSPKLSVICQPIAAKHLRKARHNQLNVATKVVLLLGGNISCMFSRKAGVWT